MKMTLHRDLLHVSTIGRSVQFVKGVPVHVPPAMVKEIIAIGGVVADDDKGVVDATMKEIQKDADDAAARAPAIVAAIKVLIERNQRGDFTAGGKPNLNVLQKMTSMTITAAELEPLYNGVVAEMA